MCHNPECSFCRWDMAEVGQYLDALLIRPILDGKRTDGIMRTHKLIDLDQ